MNNRLKANYCYNYNDYFLRVTRHYKHNRLKTAKKIIFICFLRVFYKFNNIRRGMNRCDNEEICNAVKDKGAFYRASV